MSVLSHECNKGNSAEEEFMGQKPGGLSHFWTASLRIKDNFPWTKNQQTIIIAPDVIGHKYDELNLQVAAL